jgi:hypothetical protein
MKIVTCINDKKLPEGASLTKDKEYEIEREFINPFGQKTYLVCGIRNEGITPRGLHWYGFAAERFAVKTKDKIEVEEEYAFALN